ncbi:glycine zipper 2TM domain-containing protein [Duganella hordei]|uniref:glycine zipper 2TM domain-containing protein n=1 Tax=Duganella hordei TaxID=2865934 RepID=UPI0030E83B60
MEYQTAPTTSRPHPLMLGAATSVILVSLLGAAAIAGILPTSHASVLPQTGTYPELAPVAIRSNAPIRYMTPDGQMLEAVPAGQLLAPVQPASPVHVAQAYQPAPVVHHKVAHHYAQSNYSQSARSYEQPNRNQPHPIRTYVSDMHPVGTGVGAVIGGLLGNQVGGGNGKKIATVAGVLLGGYAGNEVAHNRNPLPW